MAWATPRTWVTGEIVTAAMLNEQIRDALELPPRCRVSRITDTPALVSGTSVFVDFNEAGGEVYDAYGFHDVAVEPSRLTVPAGLGGSYDIEGCVEFAGGATGSREMRLYLGASVVRTVRHAASPTGVSALEASASGVSAAAGSYFRLYAVHTQGANLVLQGAALPVLKTSLSVVRRCA